MSVCYVPQGHPLMLLQLMEEGKRPWKETNRSDITFFLLVGPESPSFLLYLGSPEGPTKEEEEKYVRRLVILDLKRLPLPFFSFIQAGGLMKEERKKERAGRFQIQELKKKKHRKMPFLF